MVAAATKAAEEKRRHEAAIARGEASIESQTAALTAEEATGQVWVRLASTFRESRTDHAHPIEIRELFPNVPHAVAAAAPLPPQTASLAERYRGTTEGMAWDARRWSRKQLRTDALRGGAPIPVTQDSGIRRLVEDFACFMQSSRIFQAGLTISGARFKAKAAKWTKDMRSNARERMKPAAREFFSDAPGNIYGDFGSLRERWDIYLDYVREGRMLHEGRGGQEVFLPRGSELALRFSKVNIPLEDGMTRVLT